MNGTSWTTGGGGGYSNVLDSLFSPSLLSSQNPRERSFISFSDWLDQFPNASEIRRRMSTDPIVRSKMMSAYIQKNPRSANVTASAASRARMSEESPYERTMRLARDYESYRSKASLIPNNPFIMSPEEFAREDARRVADRIQRARQVTTINYQSNDKTEFKGAKAGQEKVKVPVGPGGKLQLDKVGQPATKFRMLPQSEVDRLKMEQGKAGLGVRELGVAEQRMTETEKMQGAEPRLMEQENILSGYEETEKKRSERYKLEGLIDQDSDIKDNPEYGALITDAYAAVASGVSAENAMRDLRASAKLPSLREERQRERERLREERSQKAKMEYLERATGYRKDIYDKQQQDRLEIERYKQAGNLQQAAMAARRAELDAEKHIGVLNRALAAAETDLMTKDPVEDAEAVSALSRTVSSIIDEKNKFLNAQSEFRDTINAAPTAGSVRVPEYQGFGGAQPQSAAPTSGDVRIRMPDGRIFEMDPSTVESALRLGGVRI